MGKVNPRILSKTTNSASLSKRSTEPFEKEKARVAPDTGYVLRISTLGCNFKCVYCKDGKGTKQDCAILPTQELLDIIRASVENGIYSLRWTGGEPTVHRDFADIVLACREMGVASQSLSTNGSLLAPIAEQLQQAGIERVNISLDTLDRAKFAEVTKVDALPKVMAAIKESVKVFSLTKINCVLQKSNFAEIPAMIDFLAQFKDAPHRLVLRYIELINGGFIGDNKFVEKQVCLHQEAIALLEEKYGKLETAQIKGYNPVCNYFRIPENGVVLGFIPHHSINYRCGGEKCRKLRLNPSGIISNCSINQAFAHDLRGTTYAEKVAVVKHLVEEKKARTQEDFAGFLHYQKDYHFWRFGTHSKSA
ncbi:MAG: radical SAM protein [Candidatus Micrarchaeota archaeon]|nr:radical SAM protein [Candidatus Micrarchaeota archaeon]